MDAWILIAVGLAALAVVRRLVVGGRTADDDAAVTPPEWPAR